MPTHNRSLSPLALHSYPSHTRPIIASHLTSPPSPCSSVGMPRSPLTPPLRLHLRAPLPSPALTPQTLASRPETPYPWIWRCHLCGSVYRLGVTRRCLNDGHLFCSVSAQTPYIANDEDEDEDEDEDKGSGTGGGRDPVQEMVRKRRLRRTRRQMRTRGCSGEFDYSGWARYNQWRRMCKAAKIEMASAANKGKGKARDEEEDGEWQEHKNCWEDCEFPSECLNTLLEAESRRLREVFEEASGEEDGEEQWGFGGKATGIEDCERELQVEKLREFEAGDLEFADEDPDACVVVAPETGRETDIADAEREIQRATGMVDIGLETGSNGVVDKLEDVFGVEFAHKKRRKTIHKIAQLMGLALGFDTTGNEAQPTSPLKVSFTFDEIVGFECSSDGGTIDVDHVENRDREIEELERGGSMLRRRIRRGEQGEFGDEEEEDDGIF